MSETGYLLSGAIGSAEEEERTTEAPAPPVTSDPSVFPSTSLYPCYPSLGFEQSSPSPSLEVAAAGPYPYPHQTYYQQQQYYDFGQMSQPYSSVHFPSPQIGEAYLKILNQPTNRMRFRYGSEKGSHGVLTGKDSSQKRKNYPTVKLENYFGTQPIFIKATLYTNDDTPRQHVHKLKGPNCEDGICTVKADETNTAIFQNLSIEFVGKREVSKIIFERKRKELQFESLHHDIERIKQQSNEESKAINLHVVKICFEAGIFESGNRWQLISKVYSDPIANQKSIDTGELKITRMDKYSGSCKGGDEVFLLCERVNKKDIEIRFFEEKDGKHIWEAKGHFTDSDVHHQVAIVFKTPAYQYEDINKSVRVLIQLFRPSDQETSRPIPFEYKPQVQDMSPNTKKRKKESNVEFRDSDSSSSFTISQDISDITNITYEDDEHKNSSGNKRNIEKSVLSCIDLNFDDVIKSSHSITNPSSIDTRCFPEIATKKITDISGKNKEQQFILQENNIAKDLNEILSSIFYNDIDMTDEMLDDILKDSSRDPLLASTSSFYNPSPPIQSGLYADSVIEEISPDSLIDGISNLNLEENLPKINHSKQIFQDKNENILNKHFLWIVKAFQDFIKTGNIFYIFSSMRLMINVPDEEGNNILHLAIIHQSRNLQLQKCLLTIAKVIPEDIINRVNISKQTVLHLAAKHDSPTICNFLDAGCNPNHKDINGCTVVHYAVLYNNVDCLYELVKFQQKYEVDLNILNFEGLSPLHLAVKNGHYNIVKILCTGNLNINITDGKTGRTALHYAVEFCPSLVKILLNHSEIIADLQDYNGTTPLNLAYHYDHQEIIKILNTENSVSLIENVKYDEYESEESSFSNNDETFENSNSNSKIISADNLESTREFSQEKINYNIDSKFQNREIPYLENSTLEKICELLDPPNEEWKTLAEYLIDKRFIEIVGKYSSPTKTLLKRYGGTLEEFHAFVSLAGLNHVLELLN